MDSLGQIVLGFLAKELLLERTGVVMQAKAKILKTKIHQALAKESIWKSNDEGPSDRSAIIQNNTAPLKIKFSHSELEELEQQIETDQSGKLMK